MIELQQIGIRAGEFELRDVSMRIDSGQYAALMGRTGCGKTSLLEAVAGLRRVSAGTILLDGEDMTDAKPAVRGIGYVPQDAALFTTMTVAQHLAFALEIRRVPAAAREARAAELAALLGIEHLMSRSPAKLSGGERQRVALGRAISFRPKVLLLDEPLSAVDEETREEMYALLRSVREHTGATVLHVTHNRAEADALADVVFRLEGGAVHVL